ncbi:MAG: starch-binding protein, partial [Prevotella sp.]|nr:starch-binding protein [Prevotella sp.]
FYNNKTYDLSLKTWTIYFDPSGTGMTSTSNLCAYLWVGNVAYHDWPGESMTYDESTGYFVYQFTEWSTYVDEGADVEFTNYLGEGQNNTEYGKDQSWPLHDNGLYGSSGYIGTFSGGSDSNVNTYTVYFDNSTSNWGQVYVYIWDTDSNNSEVHYSGTYPGTQMTLLNSDSSDNTDNSGNTDNSDTSTLYYYTFTTTATLSANAKVVFSNGTDSNKTGDLKFTNGATYSSTAMTTDANWFIYFDPDGITNSSDITKVEVYMWHSDSDFEEQGGTAKDYFEQTDEMWKGTGENDSNYYVYSFYSNESNLGDQRIEVKFTITLSDGTTKVYGYNQTDSGTTQVTDWYLVNHAIYGTSGFEKLNTDQSGYVTYTVYYKQSTDTTKDGGWNAVYIYVFNEDNRSDHYCNNPSWPGDPMTSLGDNQWKYTFSAPQQTEGTVEMAMDFNDGIDHGNSGARATTQTSDMMLVNNGLYEHRFQEGESGVDGSGNALAAKNIQTYIVGAEIYVSSVGYATIYSDSTYVLPSKTDHCGSTVHTDSGYYFKDNVHATAITSCSTTNAATADDGEGGTENESTGYAMTSWFEEGSVVPAQTALLIHSQAGTDTDDTEFRAEDTDITGSGRYYLARVPSSGDDDSVSISGNMLHGSSTYARTTGDNTSTSYKFYKLANDSQGLGFYFGADNGAAFLSEPNKAWLAIPETQAANLTSIKIIEEADDNTATGLGAITPAAAKRSGDAIYNLQGIRVNDMSKKGIYIVGGRKVVVR